MKGFYLILFSLLFFSISGIQAQRSNGLAVEGTVTVEKGSVDGAVIEIFRNGRKTGDYGIGSNGRFNMELNYGYEFILIFTRRDNFPLRIAVDTNVPQSVLQSNPRFPPFPLNITLFTQIDGIDKTFSENTVLKIFYSQQVDNFISETYYNNTRIKQLIDQAILQSLQIGKEAGNLDGITKAEMAEIRKDYDKLIRQAENEYNRQEYLTALDGYKAASKILPKETYPKDRIAEINDLLALMMVQQEMEKALKDRLQALLVQGDQQFDQKKYEDAKSSYQRALSVDAANAHALNRVAMIDKIFDQAQADNEYKSLITRGDNSFDELLYAEALSFYTKAMELKKGEQYPQQKIAQINDILKQQAVDAEKIKGYRESIFQAEYNYEKQFYEKAVSFYENALVHKPGDEIAIRRIAEIKELMNQLAAKTLYDKQIRIADRAFQRKQYAEALPAYQEAASLMPSENHAKQQIEKINAIFAEEERLLAEAEAEKIRKAAEAEAAEQARLAALQEEKDRQYNMALAGADSLFALTRYEEARNSYQTALQLKPDEARPKQRIDEIAGLLVQIAETNKAYEGAIALADQSLARGDYDGAKAGYQQARQVKPSESYPADKLSEIDSLLETRARLSAEAEAEKAKLAAEAEAEKQRLAAEAEAAEQERLAALEAETNRQYNLLLAGADSLFALSAYENARTAYQNALQIKPAENHPKQRIGEIERLLEQIAESQKAYEGAITLADQALAREDFDAAKAGYMEALRLKPAESYPADKITEIDSILNVQATLAAEAEAERLRLEAEAEAEQKRLAAEAEAAERERLEEMAELDRKYNMALTSADSLFALNEYEHARTAYQNALHVKPRENHPQQRIEEIGRLLVQLAEVRKTYDAAIALADQALAREDFDAAGAGYRQALNAKPDETYPQEKLAEIETLIATRARLAAEAEAEQKRLAAELEAEQQRLASEAEAAERERIAALQAETDRQYNRVMAGADSLFSLNDYENALPVYRQALQIKPEENLPKLRIDEINNILVQLADAQKAYDNAITLGDSALAAEDFDAARTAYRQAQQSKPAESYPAEKLAEIDSVTETRLRLASEAEAEQLRLAAEAEAAERERIAALQAETNRQYSHALAGADSLFSLNDYANARTAYLQASQIKPEELRPQQQIEEIDRLLGQLAEAQKAYDNAITIADKALADEDFDAAMTAYRQARQAKPSESYPAEKLAEIDSLIETQTRLAAEAEAEKARLAAEAEAAEQARQDALRIEQERLYRLVIAGADSLFTLNDLQNSRSGYQKALQIRPEELHPQQQIAQIDKVLNEREEARKMQEQVQKEYQETVALADRLLKNREYAESRTAWLKAQEIRPEEGYPREKIAEIDFLLQQQAADENYRSLVLAADGLFNTASYDEAEEVYRKALEVKPGESYPTGQVIKIEALRKQQQEKMLAEQRAAAELERRRTEIEQRQQQMNERQEMTEAGISQIYNEYISLADGFFESKNYNVSRAWYHKALDVKPRESYPTQRISEINRLINGLLLSQRDRDYQNFVNLADSTFRQNQLAVARGWYNRALTVKPEESYPKEQVQAIADLIAERMAGRSGQLFESHMKNADEAMERGNFNVARFWYMKALELRPDDAQAKEGLSKIQ